MSGLKQFSSPWRLSTLLAGSRGAYVDISFQSGGRLHSASVPSLELWISIKDVLVLEAYELLDTFRLDRLPRHSIVVDAGANAGLYTLKASPFASRVIALEPSPTNFHLLRMNIERNGAKNIDARQIALWFTRDKLGLVEAGSSSHLTNQNPELLVTAVALDEIMEELGHVDLLKMDVEGAEFDILMGSKRSTLERIDKLVAEVHLDGFDSKQRFRSMVEWLRGADMRVSVFSGPSRNLTHTLMKPWFCSLKRCDGGRVPLYRAFVSWSYFYRWLTSGLREDPLLLLFAYRT